MKNMPSKYDMILEIARQTAKELFGKPNLYPDFLRTAANNYKYRFKDQLLIYAQKPDATACADVETWNKLGRYVNKGTKGIALLVDRDVPYKLRHVFDISDTNSYHGYEVKVWQMAEKHEDAVINALENSFGEIEHKNNFGIALIDVAKSVVCDNIQDYLEKLKEVKVGSYLEELNDDALHVWFRDLLINGVAFMLMERCGYNAEKQFDFDDFSDVYNFNTPDTINVLGCATSDISEMILREIEETVRSVEREEAKNRTFAQSKTNEYDKGKNNAERSNENEPDLQTRGRLSNPKSRTASEPEDWKIWNVATHVSSRSQKDGVQRSSTKRQTEQPLRGDRPQSQRDDGNSGEQDETGAEHHREAQSGESDALGGNDEQHHELSGGNSPSGTHLQLSGHDFDARPEKDYYYAPDAKNELLRNCIALNNHRKEIAAFFESDKDSKERGNYIKSFFDNTYVEHILNNGERVGYRAYDDVLHIWHGSYLSRDKEDYLHWWRVANAIEGQILLDTWLSPDEKDLISESGQISIIKTQEIEKSNEFSIPQAAIDYVLTGGSGISQGKLRIYEQFQKQETPDKNIAFLKNEYGIGGHSDAIPESGYWVNHDGKGIELRKGDTKILLSWSKVAKRIGELVKVDRYLSDAEKAAYPDYLKESEERERRYQFAGRFNSLVEDFNDYETQINNDIVIIDRFRSRELASCFGQGERVIRGYSNEPDMFVLPTIKDILGRIISENTHLTDRAQELLDELDETDIAKDFELTESEKNPPPEPKKEYRFSLGDTVYIGTQTYSILNLEGDTIELFDEQFPILNKEMPKEEFYKKVSENPMNDKYLQEIAVKSETRTLAERLVKFKKDYDYYGYADTLEVGETDEDAIAKMEKQLFDYPKVYGIIVELKNFYEKEDDPNLQEEIQSLLAELQDGLPVDTKPKITLDTGDNVVHWIYFTPESDLGGQYIMGDLPFKVFEELIEEFDIANHPENTEKFVDNLEEMSDQVIADINTPYFMEAENDYDSDYDFLDFTPENIIEIHNAILSIETDREAQRAIDNHEAEFGADGSRVFSDSDTPSVNDREIEILYDVLGRLKIDDISLEYDADGNIVASDNYNRWVGRNFYDFLVEDAFVYDENEKPLGIPDDLLSDFKALADKYGVEIRDYDKPTTWDEYEQIKKENPNAIVIYQMGDFFELFGEHDTKVAREVLGLMVAKRTFENKSITTPMSGFPVHATEPYTNMLLNAGYNVVAATHEDGKLQVRKIVPTKDVQVGLPLDETPESVSVQTEITLAPPPQQIKQGKVKPTVLYPEIKSEYRTNFKIENDDIGVGTPLDRFYHNIRAIELLNKLEEEHRLADTNEQRILSDYVGWGGLPEFFEETNPHYGELKELLSEDEYASARESSLTAFYTPPVVIKAMYKALQNMNFKTGNVLEPSCGIGNFMGLVPDSMSDAKFYGIELDKTSGRIAQQLYQKNSIAVQGFEDTKLPDSFFDAAIGNVPFGQFKVPDKRYDKYNFLIHDYFFARTIDKVRPGGIIAFITSKGTMDKESPSVRKYIAQRADLLGAIRLPNNTFKDAAGTEVTSDIIFLQKRDRLIDIEPDWVHLNTDENGIKMNQYFVDNPDMIMGEMKLISGPHGPTPACIAYEDGDLAEQLDSAIQNIHAEITEYEFDDLVDEEQDNSIPADPDVRNFSYTVIDGVIYYRENSRMNPVDVSVTAENRIKGLIGIRDCVRTLIEYQTEDYPDSAIKEQQQKLNQLYDAFSKKYGLINSRANSSAFNQDSSYCLLSSLEILDDERNFVRKADMFSKRTIKQKVVVTQVDTASEALALSLAEKTKIDIDYMSELTGKSEEEIAEDLKGVIFLNPKHIEDNGKPKYLPADEYLSGNIREKLREAEQYAELNDVFKPNVEALKGVMPEDLSASEISVRLGATWLPPEDIENFMFELFGTARYMAWNIHVHFSEYTGEWNIEGKSYDRSNVKAYNTYGTARINGYKIIEETLNLRDVRIFDYVEDDNGKRTPVLNKKETAIAQGKQQLIKEAFSEWIWKDPERRDRLTKLYNEKFNSNRPREYDGSHLNFVGINPEIVLRPHQVNAIAHIMYGGNTLLAHVVGAGKTFEMVAAAQESKRLGLCQKSLFVVPNHLTEQWASEYLQLYPSANILVATKKDFETKNRKKFCGRIATGDYDAIIIGHSQFEKIPMSLDRQRAILENQLNEILEGIAEIKRNRGDNFSIKQLEKTKKTIKQKLDKLNDQSRKDDVVTFEELGVDRLFIDEAHYYKNLAAFTKMRNVGGISQTEAMKSSDLYMKCRYLDELTGGKGVVFATGTPISNSMVELYTMQKYLQYRLLRNNNLLHFDSWASTFGETVTAIELAPEGTGYRAKTRFAKFYNLPELMSLFKETADIQTADMLKLPVPKANYHNIALKPSEQQKEMVKALSERAEKVRNKMVDSSVDNMLLITNDGRKLALDQRMINALLPDSETSKVSACADNVYEIWEKTTTERSTQMVFCDLSTPHGDGSFNVYDDLRDKLIAKGIPREEIAYIHSANTEAAKKELFGKVRSGQVRVIIGSTQKMGAGTNVQKKLIALHHLDCPWRPSDLQQREGRIIRQGNDNPEVEIYTYVTENTFDSYLYQLVESKQKFIGQIMTSKSPVRSAEDVDEQALSYAEIKALCTGNPHIKEKMDLDIDVARLKLLKANHLSQKYSLEDQILKTFPKQISSLEERIEGYISDIEVVKANPAGDKEHFCGMTVNGKYYSEKKEAGEAIIAACKAMRSPDAIPLGLYRGFEMELSFEPMGQEYRITMKKSLRHTTPLGTDIFGNIQRLDNLLEAMPDKLTACKEQLSNTKQQLENAKVEVEKPFPHEEELKTKTARLAELNSLLDMDKKDNEIVDGEREEGEKEEPERSDDRDER